MNNDSFVTFNFNSLLLHVLLKCLLTMTTLHEKFILYTPFFIISCKKYV